jgi:hypothetical protein
MQAGSLLEPSPGGHADPAASAAGLLALTQLDHAQLAVALLVDVWPDQEGREDRVSSETAILVVDAALRSDDKNAQLIAAELLCQIAEMLYYQWWNALSKAGRQRWRTRGRRPPSTPRSPS